MRTLRRTATLQSGAAAYALFALLLLRLPDVLTFQTLYEFERLADRNLTLEAERF